MAAEFSHFDEQGASRMVDVGDKPVTHRWARVSAQVTMDPQTLQRVLDRQVAKGDVLEVARLAGIMAAKRTDELIPLCHTLPLTSVEIHFQPRSDTVLGLEARVETEAKTGVEMEAFLAATVAALTIYDMCKAVDRAMAIGPVQLEEKGGGRSGHFVRERSVEN
jgi:cyclic pyranopterin phosphate synthase